MCGRFANDLPPGELARLFGTLNALPNVAPSWNVAPTQSAVVVRRNPESAERSLDPLTWGLQPSWAKEGSKTPKPTNARAETVTTSGMFKTAFAKRRCLVPAVAWYEWLATPAGKMPYAFARQDGMPLALAGLWEGRRGADGEVTRSFAIITTEANAVARQVHPRMPVVLEVASWPLWLGEAEGDAAALMRPAADDVVRSWRVGTRVNSVRNNAADLLVPQAEPEVADNGGPNPA
ncbi:MAG: SOS response-associated peptidase [Janthinobacterium lividum]